MIRNRAVSGSMLMATLLFAATAVVPPRANAAEEDLRKCVDGAWADYNECLVGSSTSWGKKLCDIYFQAEVVLCSAKYIGEVKKSFNGES